MNNQIIKKICFRKFILDNDDIIELDKDLNSIGINIVNEFISFYELDKESNSKIIKKDKNKIKNEIENIKNKKIKEE